jgi:DNA-binding PadR family transcriptional regulator
MSQTTTQQETFMFFRNFRNHDHDHERHGHGHGGYGEGRHGWRRHGGGMGGRESRMFDSGELRLVILALVADKPRYGYEVIKALGERVGGDYSPSPGVVYPTLTLIEEMGYASASQDPAGRKLYTITPEGEAFLAANKGQVDAIFARLDGGNENRFAGGAGSVLRAMMNLRAATRLRLRGRAATPEQIQAIADALDATAKTIEKI